MIQKNRLTPNIITFGCLAYKVNSPEELEEFICDLKVSLNICSRVKIHFKFLQITFEKFRCLFCENTLAKFSKIHGN
jgi:hypothetical protein